MIKNKKNWNLEDNRHTTIKKLYISKSLFLIIIIIHTFNNNKGKGV